MKTLLRIAAGVLLTYALLTLAWCAAVWGKTWNDFEYPLLWKKLGGNVGKVYENIFQACEEARCEKVRAICFQASNKNFPFGYEPSSPPWWRLFFSGYFLMRCRFEWKRWAGDLVTWRDFCNRIRNYFVGDTTCKWGWMTQWRNVFFFDDVRSPCNYATVTGHWCGLGNTTILKAQAVWSDNYRWYEYFHNEYRKQTLVLRMINCLRLHHPKTLAKMKYNIIASINTPYIMRSTRTYGLYCR